MPLTIAKLKSIKPQKKAFKLFDGEGMFLYVTPERKMYWRLKYRYAGKEKLLAIGVFPKTGLKEARDLRVTILKKIHLSTSRLATYVEQNS